MGRRNADAVGMEGADDTMTGEMTDYRVSKDPPGHSTQNDIRTLRHTTHSFPFLSFSITQPPFNIN